MRYVGGIDKRNGSRGSNYQFPSHLIVGVNDIKKLKAVTNRVCRWYESNRIERPIAFVS